MSLTNQSGALNATYLAVYNDFVASVPVDITGAARDWLLATHSQSLLTQQQLGQSVVDLETRQRAVLDANTAEITLLRLAIQGLQAGQAAAAPPVPPAATRPKQKVAPPEKFSGHGTPKIKEWLEQVYLYLDDVVDEQLRIKLSLSYLEGDAHDYMDSYYTLVQTQQPLGTWADFVNRLTTSYDTKDKPREARLEVERLTKNPWTDMSKFAEKFKKWANKSALSNVDLIEKICRITPEKILQVHAGTDEKQWPTKWEAYLDWDLDIEHRMKRTFTTSSSKKDPDAMQVDEVKNKGKGKAKASKGEVNATDKKPSICKYCKKERKYGHRCEEYKKAMIKEGKWKEKEGGGGTKGSGPVVQRQKKYKTVVRCIEMQVTDDEEEEAESSRLAVARIREITTDDEEEKELEMLAHLEAKYPHLRSTSSEPDMLQATKAATSRLSSFWQGAL